MEGRDREDVLGGGGRVEVGASSVVIIERIAVVAVVVQINTNEGMESFDPQSPSCGRQNSLVGHERRLGNSIAINLAIRRRRMEGILVVGLKVDSFEDVNLTPSRPSRLSTVRPESRPRPTSIRHTDDIGDDEGSEGYCVLGFDPDTVPPHPSESIVHRRQCMRSYQRRERDEQIGTVVCAHDGRLRSRRDQVGSDGV